MIIFSTISISEKDFMILNVNVFIYLFIYVFILLYINRPFNVPYFL